MKEFFPSVIEISGLTMGEVAAEVDSKMVIKRERD